MSNEKRSIVLVFWIEANEEGMFYEPDLKYRYVDEMHDTERQLYEAYLASEDDDDFVEIVRGWKSHSVYNGLAPVTIPKDAVIKTCLTFMYDGDE